jgi:hypothetical protein
MRKKTWLLLILVAAFLLGYYKLFYSSMPTNVVPNNTDIIFSIDVKKNIRTAIWHYLKNPSKWSISSSKDTTDKVSIKDMFTLPDFALAFHVKNEPLKNWYSILSINEEEVFYKGLKQFGFEKFKQNVYINTNLHIALQINQDKVLVGTNIDDSCTALNNVAQNLFTEKSFLNTTTLNKIKQANNHATLFMAANNFLQEEAIIKLNYTETNLNITGDLLPNKVFKFYENNFKFNNKSLLSMGFTQPCDTLLNMISVTDKEKFIQKVGINVDSLFTKSNKYYQLDFQNIVARKDSAISYTFDDDFNKVEQVVVNNVEEPSFRFMVNGDSVNNIFSHWAKSKLVTISDTGNLFTAMPFVKSYCTLPKANELYITSKNFSNTNTSKSIDAVFFWEIFFNAIPESTKKYFPNQLLDVANRLESMELSVKKNNDKLSFVLLVQKNDKADSLFPF